MRGSYGSLHGIGRCDLPEHGSTLLGYRAHWRRDREVAGELDNRGYRDWGPSVQGVREVRQGWSGGGHSGPLSVQGGERYIAGTIQIERKQALERNRLDIQKR